MKSILSLGLLLPLINAGSTGSSSSVTACVYEVTVVDAKNLKDMDTDFMWITNLNDPYVEVIGYSSVNSETKTHTFTTDVKEGTETPEWNEKFYFDNEKDCNGEYDKICFVVWDDDSTLGSDILNKADKLGETDCIETSKIESCTSVYGEELKVYLDDDEEGTLFVEITKSGACCTGSTGGGYGDDDDKDEDKDEDKNDDQNQDKDTDKGEENEEKEEKEEKVKGTKGRRLLG